jgi:ribosomal-protein-alanine N-acetyltransferase
MEKLRAGCRAGVAMETGSALVIDGLLKTERLLLRPLQREDAPKLLQYVLENKEWLEPWEPVHPRSYFTLEGQRSILRHCEDDRRAEAGVLLGIFERNGVNGKLRGRISISGIIRGIWQNGFVGYSISASWASQGYMTEALRCVVRFGFEGLDLHRLQASIIPRNTASQRVLEKCSFRYEGRALRYLRINDVWEDHDMFAITADEVRLDEY